MSIDSLPVPVIDHTGAGDGAREALLQRLAPIGFGREICGDLAAAERREWWIGNGCGAYAAGTVAQSLTRRSHGILVAPFDPPLGRCLVPAKADAELVIRDHRVPLFTNRWASGGVVPEGHRGRRSPVRRAPVSPASSPPALRARGAGLFRYRNIGNLATIGRKEAVADFGRLKLTGRIAWFIWGLAHIYFLIGFRNRMAVVVDWLWSYLTYQRGARLITGQEM